MLEQASQPDLAFDLADGLRLEALVQDTIADAASLMRSDGVVEFRVAGTYPVKLPQRNAHEEIKALSLEGRDPRFGVGV